jgi:hypothetical protein
MMISLAFRQSRLVVHIFWQFIDIYTSNSKITVNVLEYDRDPLYFLQLLILQVITEQRVL